MIWVSVDLPEPFEPTIPKNAPRSTLNVTSFSASNVSSETFLRTSVSTDRRRLSSSPIT